MKHQIIQLSQLRSPKIGRGRPYTVDFGIAKPFYKQLLSKLVGVRTIQQSNRLFIVGAVVLLYISVLLSFFPATNKITYADPRTIPAQIQPLPQLTMPVISNVETAQTILYALSDNLPNSFVPGQCTWGIASRLPITWSGNANEWAVNAQAQGIEVTNTPTVGSIAQTSGDSYLGHVALVESLNPDGSFVVWEMNGANGPFTTDERTTTTAEFPNFILF